MEKKFILHMNAGDGSVSYANNSGLQKFVMWKTWNVLNSTLKDMFSSNDHIKCLKMVDLGCASGPNTLQVIFHIIDTIEYLCGCENLFEYEVYLNDLPCNDFNNLFKMLPAFHKNKKDYFLSALPGSFYGRLLPKKSLHFAYSCYSLHWLSQIPEVVEKNSKENICISRTSPKEVFKAYKKQFRRDFSIFLRSRGEEMISGGCMVLAFIIRHVADQSSEDLCGHLRVLAETLSDMVVEGLVYEDDLHSFNVPMYTPCQQEVEGIIAQEGSFNIKMMEVHEVPWDANAYKVKGQVSDKNKSGKSVTDCVRAFIEPTLVSHFGSTIDIDDIFNRYTKKMVELISGKRPNYPTLVISLKRK